MTDGAFEDLVRGVRKAVREELAGVRKEMAAHQKDEMAHHKRVSKTLDMVVKVWREQNKRLAALEGRVAELEALR
jgi:hypothetical protein